jgi:hypothetical protein
MHTFTKQRKLIKMAKLKKFTVIDPTQRIAVALRQSTRRAIEEYRLYYTTSYGHPVERGELIEQLLVAWFEQDVDFGKFSRSLTPEQRAAVETALGGAADA